MGRIYGVLEGSWRSIPPQEARGIDPYPAAPGRGGVTADVIDPAPGMVEAADEPFGFRYVGDRPTPLPAAPFVGKGYADPLVVVYEYDPEGHSPDRRTLTVTKELLAEGEAQTRPPRGGTASGPAHRPSPG